MRATFISFFAVFAWLCVTPSAALAENTKLSSYLPHNCYHAGQFQQQKTLIGIDKPLITEGSFVFNCDQGLLWHTQLPIIETIIYKAQGAQYILRADGSSQALDSRVQRVLGKLLNNLIGGNSDYLQQTFSTIEQADSVALTPKNKQMQKFLHSLSIAPQVDSVNINLQLAEQETIAIRIFAQRDFTNLTQADCVQVAHILPQACTLLFKGLR